MFSFRLKPNLRKPDVLQFKRFEAEICDERYQKLRDCKTAGPLLCFRMIFARVYA